MNSLTLPVALRDAANQVFQKLTSLLFPKTGSVIQLLRGSPGEILVLRTGNIGDIACAIPALAALRKNFPRARLCLLTSPGLRGLPEAGEVLQGLGLVDEIITFFHSDLGSPAFLTGLIRTIRQHQVDLFVYLNQNITSFSRQLRDLIFASLIGAKGAFGFALAHHFPLFDPRKLKEYIPRQNEVERLLGILGQFNINSDSAYKVALPEESLDFAERLLKPFSKNGPRPVIGFQVSAKADANLWPLSKVVDLCVRLNSDFSPLFLFTGSPGERENLLQLCQSIPGEKLVAAGEASVLESLALISRCQVFVSLDTGPIHLAALTGIPIVGLYSARQFKKMWEPDVENAIVLRKDVPCELCFQLTCDHLSCMEAITVDEVYNAVVKQLSLKTERYN